MLTQWFDYIDKTDAGVDLITGIFDPFGTVVVGPPYVGKTWLVLNMMLALVTPRPEFLGHSVKPAEHKIVYIGTDPGARVRAAQRLREMGLSPSRFDRVRLDSLPAPVTDVAGWGRAIRAWESSGITAVVLDNLLGTVQEGAEVSSTTGALPVLRRLSDVVDAGIGVLALAHPSKPTSGVDGKLSRGGRTPLGSVAFDANFRRRIMLSESRGVTKMSVTPNDGEGFVLSYRRTGCGLLELATDAVTASDDVAAGGSRNRGPTYRSDPIDEWVEKIVSQPPESRKSASAVARAVNSGEDDDGLAKKITRWLDDQNGPLVLDEHGLITRWVAA